MSIESATKAVDIMLGGLHSSAQSRIKSVSIIPREVFVDVGDMYPEITYDISIEFFESVNERDENG